MNYSYNGKTIVHGSDTELTLENAFDYCRQIAKHHAKTFYLATLFLPKPQRNPIFAMYALLRTVDDLVDTAEDKLTSGSLSQNELNGMMKDWKVRLEECYQGRHHNDPIMMAWHATLQEHAIPMELPLDLMDGVSMDIEFKPFETFDDLYVYCYKVASVVGLMCSEIFGYSDKKALDHAIELGIAMQLTNILRDIGEDIDRGRIYLPLEDLERFSYSRREFMQKTMNDNFRNLIRFQIERARSYYRASEKGIPMLEQQSRFAVLVSSENYSNILKTIENNGYDVFSQRAYRSLYQKLSTIPYIWYRSRVMSS
ncbi:MAG: phytoene/squalene synthase family protein [Prosthecochloris sp.]|nr:phytoene/squalene synthase family protein [Prosthecochloris sp.]